MANWRNNDVQMNPEVKTTRASAAALSAYEQALFNQILAKKEVEKAQTQFANDQHKLSDDFDVVH